MNDSNYYAKQIASMIKLQRNPDGIALFFDYKMLQGVINVARMETLQTLLSRAPDTAAPDIDNHTHCIWLQKLCDVRDMIR